MKIKFVLVAFIGIAVQMITSKAVRRAKGSLGRCCIKPNRCVDKTCPKKPDILHPKKPDISCPQKPDIECPEKPDISCPEKPDISCPERCDDDWNNRCNRCDLGDCNCY
jgi:hypothetical protein